jgi:hypothetical protein
LTDLSFQPSHVQGCFDGSRDPTEDGQKNPQPDGPEERINKRRLILPDEESHNDHVRIGILNRKDGNSNGQNKGNDKKDLHGLLSFVASVDDAG